MKTEIKDEAKLEEVRSEEAAAEQPAKVPGMRIKSRVKAGIIVIIRNRIL